MTIITDFKAPETVPAMLAGDYGPALGEGLWGRTYDLGDGTVVKLARAGGGIGDGRDLIEREAKALKAFAGYQGADLSLPAYYGHGPLDAEPGGFCRWLRLGKITGTVFSEARYLALSTANKTQLSTELGRALADYHRLSEPLASQCPEGEALIAASRRDWIIGQVLDDLPADEVILAKRLRGRYRQWLTASPRLVWAHGDVNPSNFLWDAQRTPDRPAIGLVDFAENGWDLPAVDLAHWRTLGWLDQTLLDAYGQAAGHDMPMEAVHIVGAINALIGMVLDRRLDDRDAVGRAEATFRDCLAAARLID
ncbi:MAG: aminoglycoside phosphotransferase family protein [Pseudomonadota bacterium]